MDKKDLEKLLMRFSHLGVSHSKNGTLFNFILFLFSYKLFTNQY